jgi:rubrerythrin
MSEYSDDKEICSGCGELRKIVNKRYHLCRKCNKERLEHPKFPKREEVIKMDEKIAMEPEEIEWIRDRILSERDEKIRKEVRDEMKTQAPTEKEYACASCGYEFNGKPKFCPKCGTELDFDAVE